MDVDSVDVFLTSVLRFHFYSIIQGFAPLLDAWFWGCVDHGLKQFKGPLHFTATARGVVHLEDISTTLSWSNIWSNKAAISELNALIEEIARAHKGVCAVYTSTDTMTSKQAWQLGFHQVGDAAVDGQRWFVRGSKWVMPADFKPDGKPAPEASSERKGSGCF